MPLNVLTAQGNQELVGDGPQEMFGSGDTTLNLRSHRIKSPDGGAELMRRQSQFRAWSTHSEIGQVAEKAIITKELFQELLSEEQAGAVQLKVLPLSNLTGKRKKHRACLRLMAHAIQPISPAAACDNQDVVERQIVWTLIPKECGHAGHHGGIDEQLMSILGSVEIDASRARSVALSSGPR